MTVVRPWGVAADRSGLMAATGFCYSNTCDFWDFARAVGAREAKAELGSHRALMRQELLAQNWHRTLQ